MPKERPRLAASEKIAILRMHLLEKLPVLDLCDELRLKPTAFYRWQKELLENGAAAFDRGGKYPPAGAGRSGSAPPSEARPKRPGHRRAVGGSRGSPLHGLRLASCIMTRNSRMARTISARCIGVVAASHWAVRSLLILPFEPL